MNNIKWFFMSKYKRLLYNIEFASEHFEQFVLPNGVIVNFGKGKWIPIVRDITGRSSYWGEKGKYYLITRKFPSSGHRKMELIKCDSDRLWFPEFTTGVMELDIEPYIEQ